MEVDNAAVRLGVNAVITDAAGRVLLARRDRPPIWNVPGGGVEPGETPWDAVVREVAEETGCTATVQRLTGVYDRSPDGDPVLVFRCSITGIPRTTAESTAIRWSDPDQLPDAINPYQRRRIADALRPETAPALVHQPGRSVRELFPDR